MKFSAVLFTSLAAIGALASGSARAQDDKTLGTRKNPVKLSMVPSADSTKILNNMKPIAQCMEKETGYTFDVSVPNNYIVVIESLGSKKVDVAFLPTFGYVMARERFGSQALLKASRQGETTYKAAIIARADGKVNKVSDIGGKKVAFVDPASTSGYILPKKLFNDSKVKAAEEVFGGKHDVVVTMVYQGQVDAGAVYYNKPMEGKIRDAREKVMTQFPDVEKKVKIVALTEEIPNDPIVVRKELSAEMKSKLSQGFTKCVETNVDAFTGVNNSDALAPVKDSDYDGLRATIKALKIDLGAELNKKK